MTEPVRTAIVAAGRRLRDSGLITATEGNISVREGETLYVTPAGVSKARLRPDQVLSVDLAGRILAGAGRASTELPMHLAIYRGRRDVGAIVHAHPPFATAFAVAGIPLDRPILAEAVLLLGPVPVVTYAPPSTQELADVVAAAAAGASALLLANHGAVTLAETLEQAVVRMETLEHLARVSFLARMLGRESALSGPEVERLLSLADAPYLAGKPRGQLG
jgi:L-fuculose-phosphate aldolase